MKKTYSDTFRVSFFIHNTRNYLKYLLYIRFLFEKLNTFLFFLSKQEEVFIYSNIFYPNF